MSDILILCPETHRPVPTGLTTDMVVFKTLPLVALPLHCLACGHVHKWKPTDAWIADIPKLVHSACQIESVDNSGNEPRGSEWKLKPARA